LASTALAITAATVTIASSTSTAFAVALRLTPHLRPLRHSLIAIIAVAIAKA